MPNATTPATVIIRAREPGDWEEIAQLTELPKVLWGTLRLPFTSKEHWRRMMEGPQEGRTGIVAMLDGHIVGSAGFQQSKGRRSHVAELYVWVHDDHCGRGIGSALTAALVDVADNWLNLKRLELTVYVDNVPAIRLYKKFGFEVEGTRRADSFRGGRYVDVLMMARVRDG
jgi:L-phenylalanine/L-methionine N-acetyltransferase